MEEIAAKAFFTGWTPGATGIWTGILLMLLAWWKGVPAVLDAWSNRRASIEDRARQFLEEERENFQRLLEEQRVRFERERQENRQIQTRLQDRVTDLERENGELRRDYTQMLNTMNAMRQGELSMQAVVANTIRDVREQGNG